MAKTISGLAVSLCVIAVGCGGRAPSAQPQATTPAPAETTETGAAGETPALVEDHREAVEKLAQPFVDDGWVAGMAIGLISGPAREVYGFGIVSERDRRVPDGDTVFEIGSVSKVFTAAALALRVEEGKVKLDDPVATLLPGGVKVPSYEGQPITLAHLATHTSGLPKLPTNLQLDNLADPYLGYDANKLYAFLKSYELSYAPGTRYAYSNVGAGLLGHALAVSAKTTYGKLIVDEIAAPLGMKSTAVTPTAAMKARLAAGHSAAGDPASGWHFGALAAAGEIHSTVNDMLIFVAANLALDHPDLGPAFRLMRAPRAPAGGGVEVALGWHVNPDGTIWHNGRTGGYASFVAFDPKAQVGVVVLASTSQPMVDALGGALVHMLRGEPYALKLPASVKLDPALLDRYTGVYRLAPSFELTVTRDGDALMVQATNQPAYRVYATSETEFYYRVVDAQITFQVSDTGEATGLILHQSGHDLPAKKLPSNQASAGRP